MQQPHREDPQTVVPAKNASDLQNDNPNVDLSGEGESKESIREVTKIADSDPLTWSTQIK